MDDPEENSPSSKWVMPPQPSPPRQPASSRPSDSELPAKRDLFKARIHHQAEDLVDELFELADRTTAACENLPNRLEYLKSLQSVLSIGTKQIQDTITALAQYLSKRKVLLPLSSQKDVSTLATTSSSSTAVEAAAVESASSSNKNESNDVEPESSLPGVASKESFLSAVSSSSIETERDNMMKRGTNFFLASPQRNPSPPPYSSDDAAVFASKSSSSDDRPATFQPDSPVALQQPVKPTANLKRHSMPAPSSSTDLLSSSTSAFQSLSLQSPQQRKSLSFISKVRALCKEPSTTPFVDSAALKRSLSNYFDQRNGSPPKRQRSIADDVIYGSLYCVLGEDKFEKKKEEEDLDVIAYGLNCPIADCPSKAIQPNMLFEHMKEVHGKTSYVCLGPTCTQEFANLDKLAAHGVFHADCPCPEPSCTSSFAYESHLKAHIFEHHQTGIFLCSAGGCRFTSTVGRAEVRRHQVKQHELSPSVLENVDKNPGLMQLCSIDGCFAHITSARSLANHQKTYHREWACSLPGCSFSADLKGTVIEHALKVHYEKKEQKVIEEGEVVEGEVVEGEEVVDAFAASKAAVKRNWTFTEP